MPAINTNQVNLAVAREASIGTLPGSPVWKTLEPNDIGRFGLRNTTVSREPISGDRMERAGTLTDIEAGVEFAEDWTMDAFRTLGEGFCLADFTGPAVFDRTDTLAVGATAYTVAAGGALAAGTLVYARGFALSGNNGLKVVDAGSTATDIEIVSALTAEASPPAGARVEVAGVRGATGDLEIDASGDLISTVLDFTTLDLTVGQIIHIGGLATANKFATAANYGPARIVSIAANKIVLENRLQAFAADNGATKNIDILFGQFLRPVLASHADYNLISHTFEQTSPTLGSGGTPRYEYAKGGIVNTIGFEVPLSNKCGMNWAIACTTVQDPTGTQETNAANSASPVATEALSSSIDVARMRFHTFDSSGYGSCFKSLNVQINNNATPDKCIGVLGANSINIGTLQVRMNAEVVLTDEATIAALNQNTTVTFDFVVRNADGAIAVDIPAMKLGGGNRSYPKNESVRISLENQAFKDPTLGYPISFSLFPYMPPAA